jgi:GxxExxY protein
MQGENISTALSMGVLHERQQIPTQRKDENELENGGERRMEVDEVTERIIGAAIEVHRRLGPGLLESAYHACLIHEFEKRGIRFERQVALPIVYDGVRLECAYRIDIVVEGCVIVELKAIESVLPVHGAQLLSYLRLARLPAGLLINFHVPALRDGIRRYINSRPP